jgi:hypothetical protein
MPLAPIFATIIAELCGLKASTFQKLSYKATFLITST